MGSYTVGTDGTTSITSYDLQTSASADIYCTITGSFAKGVVPEVMTSCEGLFVSEVVDTPDSDSAPFEYKIRVTTTSAFAGANMTGKLTVMVPYYGTTGMSQLSLTATSPELNIQSIPADKTTLTYSVSNTSEDLSGKKLKMIYDYDSANGGSKSWITETTLDANGATVVNLQANTTSSPRQCTITAVLPSGKVLDRRVIQQEPWEGTITNLADDESANCYIINSNGTYMLPTRKGNSTTPIEGIVGLPEEVWSDNDNRFEFLSATSDYIVFRVEGNGTLGDWMDMVSDGNTLVAVKDKNGNILWSWHLWFVKDYDFLNLTDNQHSYPAYDSERKIIYPGIYLLNRSLGASSTNQSGFYYQWGRKDPLRLDSDNSVSKSVSGDSYEGSILYPETFYKNWTGTDGDAGWETDNDSKSVNDPCPPGYKVPTNNVWLSDAIDKEKSSSSYFAYNTTTDTGNLLTGQITYPYSSYINNGSLTVRNEVALLDENDDPNDNKDPHILLSTKTYKIIRTNYEIMVAYSGTSKYNLGGLWTSDGYVYFDKQVYTFNENTTSIFYRKEGSSSWSPRDPYSSNGDGYNLSALKNIPLIGSTLAKYANEIIAEFKQGDIVYYRKNVNDFTRIIGKYDTYVDLQNVSNPQDGDVCVVGTIEPHNFYIYNSEKKQWDLYILDPYLDNIANGLQVRCVSEESTVK